MSVIGRVGRHEHLYKVIDGEEHKLCALCKQFVVLANCTLGRVRFGGRRSYGNCKPCVSKKRKIYRQAPRHSEVKRAWEAANRDKVRAGNKIASAKYFCSEKGKATRAKYAATHAEKLREVNRQYSKEKVKNISDAYARQMLADCSPLKGSQFPQEIVDAKRELMKLRRELKGDQYERRSRTT
jgi:hypothetical protein|tara:strand:- start:530 stop:1078 length:549 start_codon:yes stop_codon:yes gene_type:complete